MQKYITSALKIIKSLQTGCPIDLFEEKRADINDFFEDLFLNYVAHDPQELTRLELFETIGIRGHNAFLTDYSIAAVERNMEKKKVSLRKLEEYAYDQLTPEQQLSYKIFHWMFRHALLGERFLFHDYRVSQMSSIIFDMSMLFAEFQPIKDAQDVEYYIARLNAMPKQLDNALELLKFQETKKIYLPRCAIQKMINILAHQLQTPVQEHGFYTRLAQALESIDATNKQQHLVTVAQIIEKQIYPAYARMHDYFTQLHEWVNTDHGVWALPDGDAYYQFMLKSHTTTDLSADEIHHIGLQEVARIEQEMRAILAANGLVDAEKNVADLIKEFTRGDQWHFPNTNEGRESCLAHYYAILDRCRTELYPLFDVKPQSLVKIQRVPKEHEEGQPGAYYSMPNLSGTRPGIFFANLRNMQEVTKFGMETLTIHEAEPGHHFQLALQCELPLPTLRKIGDYNAFYEGWALYTEKLAYEHGFYSSPQAQLGHLQDEMLRAARLVVDTGIHSKRWSKEQAVEYMKKATGQHHNLMVTEVERYFVLPGQACSYKIGQLKILALRKKAKEALGEHFDIRQFHNVILKTAAVPLIILEEAVDGYIQATLAETFPARGEIQTVK